MVLANQGFAEETPELGAAPVHFIRSETRSRAKR
jgi:hypothetical protein